MSQERRLSIQPAVERLKTLFDWQPLRSPYFPMTAIRKLNRQDEIRAQFRSFDDSEIQVVTAYVYRKRELVLGFSISKHGLEHIELGGRRRMTLLVEDASDYTNRLADRITTWIEESISQGEIRELPLDILQRPGPSGLKARPSR